MDSTKTCELCSKEFTKREVGIMGKRWEKRRFCSRKCMQEVILNLGNFPKGHTPWNAGKSWDARKNEGNSLWRGDKASIIAIHEWVKRRMPKEKKCQICGTEENRMYHIANISGEYKRNVSDYMRLCVPCHKRYDLNRIGENGRSQVAIKKYTR